MRDFVSNLRINDGHGYAAAYEIQREMAEEEAAWIAELRAKGIKAAHPDDGWVNRAKNEITFVYPQFNDGAGVGDLVALGWPAGAFNSRTRIVRLAAACGPQLCGGCFSFEEIR